MERIADKELNELAVKFCIDKVRQELKGEFVVDLTESETEWDPTFFRFIHEADLEISKKLGVFKIIVDNDENLIGFVNPFLEKDCEYRSINEKDLLAIICSSPIFKNKRVELTSKDSDSNGAILCNAIIRLSNEEILAYRIRINPATKEIISAEPMGMLNNE